MSQSIVRLFAVFVPLALAASGCSSNPAQPTPTTTESFSGSFSQGGSDSHTFTVQKNGTVNVTLTSEAPLTTMTVGLGLGTWDGSTCTLVGAVNAVQGTAMSGAAATGTFCVEVYDVGNVVSPTVVNYTVQVDHS